MGALDCVKNGMRTGSTEVFTINLSSNSTLNESRRDLESQQLKSDLNKRRHSIWWTIAVDLPLLALVIAFIGLIEFAVIPSNKTGFYCRDPTLAHAFTGDTVSMNMLLIVVIILPLGVFWITELIFSDKDTLASKCKQACFRSLRLFRIYSYGLLLHQGIVELMKGVVGSPRPTFYELCKPDNWDTCNESEYVSSYTCTSDYSAYLQSDASRSFPSGHSSMSAYFGFFLAWYFQKRAFCWSHRTVFLVPFLQLAVLSFSAVTSMTRITDHRHHWWDVLVGLLIGLAAVYYAVRVLSNNFSQLRSSESNETLSEGSRPTVKTIIFDGRREDTTP